MHQFTVEFINGDHETVNEFSFFDIEKGALQVYLESQTTPRTFLLKNIKTYYKGKYHG